MFIVLDGRTQTVTKSGTSLIRNHFHFARERAYLYMYSKSLPNRAYQKPTRLLRNGLYKAQNGHSHSTLTEQIRNC